MGIFTNKLRAGVEIGQKSVRAAGVGKSGGRLKAGWLAESPLPDGLILNSFTEPNITDVFALSEAVRRLLAGSGHRGGAVRVALPDYVSRVAVVELDSVPGKDDETERMLKWKLKKTLPFDVEQATLRFQYLGRFKTREKEQHRFLASVIKSDILAQYERAFVSAGLRPEWIETASFAVWNLFSDHVSAEAGAEGSFALVNLSGGKLTVIVFDRGVPHFLRLKDLGMVEGGDEASRVLRELDVSLTYYRENYAETPVTRVYLAGDGAQLKALTEQMPREMPFTARLLDIYAVLAGEGGARKSPVDALAFAAACGAAAEG